MRPQFFAPHLFSVAALAYLGRWHQAHDALEITCAKFPEQIDRRRQRPSWGRPDDWAIKTKGIQLAADGPR